MTYSLVNSRRTNGLNRAEDNAGVLPFSKVVCVFGVVAVLLLGFKAGGQGSGKGAGAAAPSGSGSTGGGSSQSPASGGGGALAGQNYSKDAWQTSLRAIPTPSEFGITKGTMVFVCYNLVNSNSASQPFILQAPAFPAIARWQQGKQYDKGDLVVPSAPALKAKANSHYYQAQQSGWSGDHNNIFGDGSQAPQQDGSVKWKDMGSYTRVAGQSYKKGDLIEGPDGSFYQAISKGQAAASPFGTGATVQDGGSLIWRNIGKAQPSEFPNSCANSHPAAPMVMNQVLSVAINMKGLSEETKARFKLLNLNLTNQQGSPLNPTPIRAGIAAPSATGPAISTATVAAPDYPFSSEIYYLTWPNALPGDTIPTINVNLVYTPVAPALVWQAGTYYPAGSVVIARTGKGSGALTNGHYYLAINGGTSSSVLPPLSDRAITTSTFVDGVGLGWKDMGPIPSKQWAANLEFSNDELVLPVPANGHYYRAVIKDLKDVPSDQIGKTGPAAPAFPTDGTDVKDNGIYWKDLGTIPVTNSWKPNTAFASGVLVEPVPANGHYYQAVTSNPGGTTGLVQPGFPKDGTVVADGAGLVWKEAGSVTNPPVWKPSHAYAEGDKVTSDPSNGHYYQAQARNGTSGTSNSKAPAFPVDSSTVQDSASLSWKDLGPAPVFPAWQANTAFAKGATIVPSPANGHSYQAQVDGVTGQNQPLFSTNPGSSTTEPSILIWIDAGSTLPSGAKNLKTWTPTTAYFVGDVVQSASSGHYYSAIQAGISGSTLPGFEVPSPLRVTDQASEPKIVWQDLGTSLPSSVSSVGAPPSDQQLSLLNYTLPQVHALSYFNLAAGFVVSSVHTVNITNTGSTTAPNWISTSGGITYDPILALTAYFKPIDAERPWQKSDLTPGLTIGFSLTSPSTNFYVGGSSEFPKLRNVQIVYGVSLIRTSTVMPPLNSATAVTKQSFQPGGFGGLTFNILGFIQSLFTKS